MATLKRTESGAAKKGTSKKPSHQRDSRITKNGSRNERDAAPRARPTPVSADGATRRPVAPPPPVAPAGHAARGALAAINIDSDTDASSTDSGGSCVFVESDVRLSALIRGLVLKKLSGRVNSSLTSHTQPALKAMLDEIIRIRPRLLEKALNSSNEKIPKSLHGMLLQAIPTKVAAKISKANICNHMVKCWDVLHYLLKHVKLHRDDAHDIGVYVALLEDVEKACRRDLAALEEEDKNSKSIKLTPGQMARKYLQNGFAVNRKVYVGCAKCNHGFHDHPNTNKAAKKKNANATAEWNAKRVIMQNWKDGKGPALRDEKGEVIGKIANPKFIPELIVCHCWQNHHSRVAGGMKCPVNCFDAKTGIQYDAGSCPMSCRCDCSFVCSTLTYHKKRMHFQLVARQKDRVDDVALAGARVLLDDAARVRDTAEEEAMGHYSATVAAGTPRECVLASARNEGFTAQANHILNTEPTSRQFDEIDDGVRRLQHKNGPTWTSDLGDMRVYKGARAAKQRGRNTGLDASLTCSAAASGVASSLTCSAAASGVASSASSSDFPPATFTTSRKSAPPREKFNLFENPSIPSERAVAKMWTRTSNRVIRGIRMDKSKDELTEDQKRERKRAKLTKKSMRKKSESERTEVVKGWMVTDGVSLSEASKYERGKFQSQEGWAKYDNGELSDSDSD